MAEEDPAGPLVGSNCSSEAVRSGNSKIARVEGFQSLQRVSAIVSSEADFVVPDAVH